MRTQQGQISGSVKKAVQARHGSTGVVAQAARTVSRTFSARQLLVFGDLACVVLALILAAVVRFGYQGGAGFFLDGVVRIPVSLGSFLFSFYWFGLYHLGRRVARRILFFSVVKAVVGGVVLDTLVQYSLYVIPTGRGVAILNGVLLSATLCCWRLLFEEGRRHRLHRQNVLILGTDEAACAAYRLLQAHRRESLRVVGFLGNGGAASPVLLDKPVYREERDPSELLQEREVRLVVVPGSGGRPLSPASRVCLLACLERNVEIVTTALLYERLTGRVPCELASSEWFIQSMIGKARERTLILKRAFDLLAASLAVLALFPVWVIIAALVRVSSPGGIFFLQDRVGQSGRIFRIIKFRTMHRDAEQETGPVMARRGDGRVTPIGRFLRYWHLDELPQLFNVLRGEMSLVGPRPERLVFVRKLERYLPLYNERHALPPGMTGWAQIQFRYCASLKENITKFEYDLYYLKNMTISLDIFILLETARRILQGQWSWKARRSAS